jgi:putative NADH-flavin reductase
LKLTIFGATGRTGKLLVEQALAKGHEVVAFVRNPSKLALHNDWLTLVPGDIQDAAAVTRAVAGAEAVISVLGPSSNKPVFEITRGTGHILAAMRTLNVRRLVISSGAGIRDPNDAPKLLDRLVHLLVRLFSRNVYEDMKQAVAIVRSSDRDWVVVRVPALTDAPPTGKIRAAYVGKGMGLRISRADLAAFMLEQVEQDTYLCKAPAIST